MAGQDEKGEAVPTTRSHVSRMSHGAVRRAVAVLAVVGMLTAACGSSPDRAAAGSAAPTHNSAAAPRAATPAASSPAGAIPTTSTPATSPADASGFPVTLDSAAGTVTLTAAPRAIVSLSPSLTEMLYAIGAGSQVKAVDTYSDYPAGAPRTDLDAYHLNIEALADYAPDLVVAAQMSPGELSRLAALHIPVISEPSATGIDDVYAQIRSLGAATGHTAQADDLTRTMSAQIKRIAASVPRPATPRTYYYELSQKLSSATSQTFIGQLLALLGLTSIADAVANTATTPGYPRLSAEFILEAQPDYIFLSEVNRYPEAANVASRPGWSKLSAVTGHRVIVIDDDLATRWGPRIVDLLRDVAQAITQHPAP